MSSFLRDIDDVDQFLDNSSEEKLKDSLDQYYDSLGFSGLNAEFLSDSMESMSVGDADVTFLMPRQINTDTVEQIGMVAIANQVGDFLVDRDYADDYEVAGLGITDKMVSGQNFLKRGYAFPAVIGRDSIEQSEVTQVKDGNSLASHSVLDQRPVTEEHLESEDVEVSSLRDYYRSISEIVEESGLVDDLHSDIVTQMIQEEQPPGMLGVEDAEGKIVPLKYDSTNDRYESVIPDNEISYEPEEAAQIGILSPEDNYEKVVFPLALHPEYFHMLNGLHSSKFQTQNTERLADEVEHEFGNFPFIDFSTSERDYHDSVPDKVIETLKGTKFGTIHDHDNPTVDQMVLNTYPSGEIKSSMVEETENYRAQSFEQTMRNVIEEVYNYE